MRPPRQLHCQISLSFSLVLICVVAGLAISLFPAVVCSLQIVKEESAGGTDLGGHQEG